MGHIDEQLGQELGKSAQGGRFGERSAAQPGAELHERQPVIFLYQQAQAVGQGKQLDGVVRAGERGSGGQRRGSFCNDIVHAGGRVEHRCRQGKESFAEPSAFVVEMETARRPFYAVGFISTLAMYCLVASGSAFQIFSATSIPISAKGIRKIGHQCQLQFVR